MLARRLGVDRLGSGFDGLVGVTDRLDIWAQVPYFDLSFNDAADDRHSDGIGDIRLSARYNLFQLRGGSIPVSARFTVKAPVADLSIDAEIIPLGEGQWDYEAWLESGISLWPLPFHSVLWLGYRWRTLNEETTRGPGDELTFLAEVGGTRLLGGLGAKVLVDGIFGRSSTDRVGFEAVTRRQVHSGGQMSCHRAVAPGSVT